MVTLVVALVVGVSIVIVLWLVRGANQPATVLPRPARELPRWWLRLRALLALAGLLVCLGALVAGGLGTLATLANDLLRAAADE